MGTIGSVELGDAASATASYLPQLLLQPQLCVDINNSRAWESCE